MNVFVRICKYSCFLQTFVWTFCIWGPATTPVVFVFIVFVCSIVWLSFGFVLMAFRSKEMMVAGLWCWGAAILGPMIVMACSLIASRKTI